MPPSLQADGYRDGVALSTGAPSIEFADVSYIYRRETGALVALDKLSFQVGPGESVALIGPSGCGKSTALHMAAGLAFPTEGRMLVDGRPVDAPRKTTAYIPQNLGLFPWKTVYQNVSVGLALRHHPKGEVRRRTVAALSEVGLEQFSRAYPKELSGGMRQRLALARALALDMDVLLMDEPLSAIDALLRENLQETLLALWQRRGHTQILVTHSIDEAVYLGQRIVVLSPRPGHVVAELANPSQGTPGFRDSAAFNGLCRKVREVLAEADARVEAGA